MFIYIDQTPSNQFISIEYAISTGQIHKHANIYISI